MKAIMAMVTIIVCASRSVEAESSAKALWAKVLQAKGGVQRLQQIDNIVVTETPWSGAVPLSVTLLVFPDLLWRYVDESDSILGVSLVVVGERGGWWSHKRKDRKDSISHTTPKRQTPNDLRHGVRAHALFLLESRFVRPSISRSGYATIGVKRYPTVEADYQGSLFRMYIDPRTFAIARVEAINHAARNALLSQSYNDPGSYVDLDGLRMPSAIRGAKWLRWRTSIQLNVDYRPNLFQTAPDVDAGPHAWMRER